MAHDIQLSYSTPADRATYWSSGLMPFQLMHAVLQSPGYAHRYQSSKTGEQGWNRSVHYESGEQWARERAEPTTLSLDAIPPPDRFLVFDFDIRSNTTHRPACVTSKRHDLHDVCLGCWESHVKPAMLVLDGMIEHAFGFPHEAALRVFSGGNGLHVWYRLDKVDRAVQETLATSKPFRELLIKEYLAAPRLSRLEGLTPWPVWDANATVDVFHSPPQHSAHPIKVPFSLHARTGMIALPLTRHGLPPLLSGHPPIEDYVVGRQLLDVWASGIDSGK